MNINTETILAIPAAEKIELIGLLWDNLGETESPIAQWADTEAKRRRDGMIEDPTLGSGHNETWDRISKRNG